MKKTKKTGQILMICGSMLSILGIIILLAKGTSTVSFMSLPVIFFGILIWINAEKDPSAKEVKDQGS